MWIDKIYAKLKIFSCWFRKCKFKINPTYPIFGNNKRTDKNQAFYLKKDNLFDEMWLEN